MGKSETAGEYINLFKPVCSTEKIYIHKSEGKVEDLTPPAFNIPNIQAISPLGSRQSGAHPEPAGAEALYTHFLEQFMPASVILNQDDSVLHFFGNYGDYLTLAPGKATLNFFSMLHKDLNLAAATAVQPLPHRAQGRHLHRHRGGLPFGPQGGGPERPAHPLRGRGQRPAVAVLFLGEPARRHERHGGKIRSGTPPPPVALLSWSTSSRSPRATCAPPSSGWRR